MTATEIHTFRGDLVIETEVIEVTSNLPKPDPNWRYTDAAGHEHHRDADPEPYPTLVRVVDETWWCNECGDEHTDSHLECPLCREAITPGLIGPSGFREFAPGRTSYRLNGVEIDEASARMLYDEIHGGAA